MNISMIAKIRHDQQGTIFLGLIMIIIIFAALGAAMMSMTTTSTFSRVWTGSTSRAYYLAESGFRYANTEYQNASDTDSDGSKRDQRNQLLIDWHSPDPPDSPVLFSFSGSEDKFELKIYPFFLVTSTSHTSGSTSLQAKFSGEQPSIIIFSAPTGELKIGNDTLYSYTNYSYNSETKVYTFTLSSGLASDISDNMDIYLVGNSASSQTLTNGGDLTLTDASFFPESNGVFRIDGGDGTVYAYKSKDVNTLQDIFAVYDSGMTFSVAVGASDDIIMNPFLELHAIGIVDYGSNIETRREIVYNVPLATDEKETLEFTDTFEDKSSWDTALGDHDTPDIDGDKAFKITDTGTVGSSDTGSLAKLKWSQTNIDLELVHRRAGVRPAWA